jgi:ectoine hydroxylase-related dioxygenase (phytanoyl-CoA dioxygenase family)
VTLTSDSKDVLTAEQKAAFQRDGYVFFQDVLTKEEVRRLQQRTEDIAAGKVAIPDVFMGYRVLAKEPAVERGEASATHPLDELRKFEYPAFVDPMFREVAQKPLIADLLEALLETPDVKLLWDQMFVKPPRHGSAKVHHQDADSWPYIVPQDNVTCWIALDDATVANGCLRYLPGTHHLGLIRTEHLPQLYTDEVLATEVPVEVPAGSCVLHHCLTLHASGSNTTPYRRRGWALHCARATSRNLSRPGETSQGTSTATWECLTLRGQSYPGCL